jgi:Ca-activated chloride channel family protein
MHLPLRAATLALTVSACVGCRGARALEAVPRSASAEGTLLGTFLPVADEGAVAPPDADELLRDATVGTRAGPEVELASRMQMRPLRFPKAPRGATARFNLDDGRRAWVTSMPSEQLLNTPAYAKGKVMLGGGFASHEMVALDAFTGEPAWTAPASDGGPSSPIVEGDDVIFNTESCELFVLDVATGKTLWHRFLGDPLMSQPAAADGLVFSAYPSSDGHEFGAFRLRDGEPVWHQPIDADVVAAPQVAGDSVYLATMNGTAARIERKTGHVVWTRDVGAASAPIVDAGRVLLTRRVAGPKAAEEGGAAQEQPVVLAASNGKTLFEGERIAAPYFAGNTRDRALARTQAGAWGSVPSGDHLGLTNVTMGWAFQGSTATVADGRAYYAMGGSIRARDVASGHVVWQRAYAEAKDAQAVSPPAVVGGQMFFGTVDGHLYAVDVDTGMTTWAYDVGEPVVYQPIVAQGWLYATTAKGRVLGLQIGDPTLDGWHMWGGNARHAGLVETAGAIDPSLLASAQRPPEGTMRMAEEGRAPREDLPLAGTDVHAEVRGPEARVTVVQHFRNPYDRPIEAVYLFPLPADAAVDAMEMHIGSRVVRAEVQRRADAQRTFAEAKASGKRAALLEQQRPNLFAQRVANIGPGEAIDVRIAYAHPVAFEDGRYEFVFPMGVPKRFDPAARPGLPTKAAGSAPSVAAAGADLGSAPPVTLELAVDAGMPIGELTSPTHALEVVRPAPSQAIVHLPAGAPADHDLVVRYATGGEAPRAAVLAHREGDAGYFSLVVQPPAGDAPTPAVARDVTLVLDTSSSMHGRPLADAIAVAERIVRGLGSDDTIDVVAFADTTSRLDVAPLVATPEGIARAVAFLEKQRAVGSTQMAPALRGALKEHGPESAGGGGARLRLAVLMSDGFLGNEADVLAEIARDLGTARLYALGVGASPNRFLLERAAEIGRGRAIFVAPSDDPQAAGARFTSWIERPVFTDVSVDWGGLDVSEVYPKRAPDLFAGKPLVLAGRYARGGRSTIRVRGSYGGKRYERAIDVELPASGRDDHEAQRILWARAAVHERMQAMTLREDPRLVEEVAQLGLHHHMVTPWTSLVAVDAPVADGVAEPQKSVDGVEGGTAAAQVMLSPARTLPGDPEVRIAAPADARAVTVDLPFGETVQARWDEERGDWVARFLVPRDAEDGVHSVRVTIVRASGQREVRTTAYTVDTAPPKLAFEVRGEARPGQLVTVRAVQSGAPVDARRVELRMPDGTLQPMAQTARGVWEARVRIPADARGTLRVHAFAVDLAANVGEDDVSIEVRP